MARSLMPVERRKKVLEMVQELGSVSVNELSVHFNVSEETIRRDLQQLENESRLSRAYGGAYLGDTVGQDVPFSLRKDTKKKEKEIIARGVKTIVQSGDTIFLCPSTTSLMIAQAIRNMKNLTIITNALFIANVLADSEDIRVICTGGELDKKRQTFSGCTTLEALNTFYADKAFVSCTGVSLEGGLTDSSEIQGRVRQTMLKHSQRKFLIADHTKFGKTTLSSIAPISDINCVICDQALSPNWLDTFHKYNIDFIDASQY
mgnify:FL=1